MKREGLHIDRIVASPALRVIETLDDVADGYGAALDPEYDKRIYLASPATLLDVIHQVDASAARLMIVGHNPGLERLALLLTDGPRLRSDVAIKYQTAALADTSLPVRHCRTDGSRIVTLATSFPPPHPHHAQ